MAVEESKHRIEEKKVILGGEVLKGLPGKETC